MKANLHLTTAAMMVALFVAACSDDGGTNEKHHADAAIENDAGDTSDTADSATPDDGGDTSTPPTGDCAANATPTADDSDGDGLTDAEEQAGWTVRVDEDGQGTIVPRQVKSAIDNPDTDGDGLCDDEESSLKTDPTVADTDQDGLDDADEVRQWASSPINVDTDGDANGNPLFFDGSEINTHGTSPTLADTDGDGRSDFEEINQNATNALLADLPQPALKLVGTMDLGVNAQLASGSVQENVAQTSLEQSQSATTSETNEVATGSSVENTESLTVEASVSYPWGASLSASGTVSQTEGYFNNETSSWTSESTQSAAQAYSELVGNTRENSSTIDSGTIAMQMKIVNEGTRTFEISDVVLTALLRDPSNPGSFTSIDTLTLPPEANNQVIGEGQDVGPYRIEADIPANVALSLLSNPSGIFFQVASFKLNDRTGENFNFSIGETTSNRTALVVLDYGGEKPKERYRVATNVERNADGTLAGVKLEKILTDVLNLEKGTDFVTTADSNGVTKLTALNGVEVADESTDGPLQFWTIIASSSSTDPNIPDIDGRLLDDSVNFEDRVVMPRDKIYITYVTDADRDGLFRREEALYGTYDDPSQIPSDAPAGVTATDSDGDGLTDFEEVREGWKVNLPTLSPYDVNDTVYSDPTRADVDGDGVSDPDEKAAGTDPRVADTDQDLSPDGDDPEPANPAVTGNFAPSIDSFSVSSSGLSATVTAAVSDANLTKVDIDWNGEATDTVTSGFGSISASHDFTGLGQVTVTITATDSFGETATDSRTLTLSVPTSGMVGEWLFAGNLDDTSGNGHNASGSLGSVGNGCTHLNTDRNGMSAQALELNVNYGGAGCGVGTVGYITLPSLGLSNNFTISMWLNAENHAVYMYNSDWNGYSPWLRFYSGSDPDFNTDHYGSEAFILTGSGAIVADSGTSVPRNNWVHYVLVASTSGGTTTTKVYRDGVQVSTASGGGVSAPPSGNVWFVGNAGGNGPFSYMQGRVDDIRVYNRALSAGEVLALSKE